MIYFWWEAGQQFWLFTLYDKDEASDLSRRERTALKEMLKRELARIIHKKGRTSFNSLI